MFKLEKIIERLNQQGYKIKSIYEAGKGKNGIVFRLSSEREDYALKIINGKSHLNGNSRAAQEAQFTMYLDYIDTKRHPTLKEYNDRENWILTKWIQGEKIERFNIKNIDQIIKFITDINAEIYKKRREYLRDAIDRYKSVDDCIDDIKKRYYRYEKSSNTASNSWPKDVLRKYIDASIEETIKKKPNTRNKSWWIAEQSELIASPSDMGIHNTLANKGELFFIDFEYGGLDDMSKLISDLVLQPENLLNEEQEKRLIDKLEIRSENNNWVKRYQVLKQLNIAKWTLIILNSDKTPGASEKAEKYFLESKKD